MDWNWFFSSLSQSSAAIVGIFGAFIITKILSNQSTYSEKVHKCRDTLTKCRRAVDAADGLYFRWYNKHTNNRQYEKLEELFEDEDYLSPEQYFDQLNFSDFSPREEILERISLAIERHKTMLDAEREALRQRAASYQKLNPGFAYLEPAPQKLPNFSSLNMDLIENLQKERDAIDSVAREARHHMRLASDMLDSIKGNPESSPQITYALILVTMLFFLGVVYPLSFMPVNPEGSFNISLDNFFPVLFSLKGAFLSSLSAIFGAVLVMFFWLNISLKHPQETIEKLESYTKISSYSEYFSIMDRNESLGAASHDG
ncbi:hypothetical protein [Vibrio algivorus]|uniref:DUF4239 domain-containing protein n=1 Tax=Vibrio algivorus TaxID=1667024 RepID=A0ABQ6EQW4_9VIBR|nr:hypothetical protein [Vibrio algivorus]GLT15389.1 hypothetical protein GCM10007931_23640 [Vibrio algivorus]